MLHLTGELELGCVGVQITTPRVVVVWGWGAQFLNKLTGVAKTDISLLSFLLRVTDGYGRVEVFCQALIDKNEEIHNPLLSSQEKKQWDKSTDTSES